MILTSGTGLAPPGGAGEFRIDIESGESTPNKAVPEAVQAEILRVFQPIIDQLDLPPATPGPAIWATPYELREEGE